MKCVTHMEKDALGICNYCGKSVCDECVQELNGEKYCKECVAFKTQGSQKKEHTPSLAAFLSVVISGLGQMYNGQMAKGILIFFNPFIVFTAAGVLAYFLRVSAAPAALVVLICALAEIILVYIHSIRDAYVTACKIKEGIIAGKQKTGCLIAFVIGIAVMMMVIFVAAVLAAIAIPNLLKARINANEQSAEAVVKRIMSGIELYRLANNGRYPRDESALVNSKPLCLDQRYSSCQINGYLITEVFRPDGYTIVALPVHCKRTGNKIFAATTGQKIEIQPCSSQEPTQDQEQTD